MTSVWENPNTFKMFYQKKVLIIIKKYYGHVSIEGKNHVDFKAI